MRKVIFLFVLMMSIGNVCAQNYKNDGKPYGFYCKIYKCGNNIIGIRWPENKKDNTLCDESGQELKFSNAMEALTYMSKRGWDLESVTYIEPTRDKAYILKKMVTNDLEAKDGLYFTKDFK